MCTVLLSNRSTAKTLWANEQSVLVPCSFAHSTSAVGPMLEYSICHEQQKSWRSSLWRFHYTRLWLGMQLPNRWLLHDLSVLPDKLSDITWKYATTCFFLILSNSIFSNDPTIWRHTLWATDILCRTVISLATETRNWLAGNVTEQTELCLYHIFCMTAQPGVLQNEIWRRRYPKQSRARYKDTSVWNRQDAWRSFVAV